MANSINLKLELTKNGKVLSKSEWAKLKKSNPSKEELDKLGVKITQENDTHIQMQLGDETIVNARFDREHESEGMKKPKQKGPQTTANSLKTFYVVSPISSQQRNAKLTKHNCSPCIRKVLRAFQHLGNHLFWKNRK